MSPSKLGVFANLVLAASAVLLPPTITADDLGDFNALAGLEVDPLKRSVALECPGCAFATQEEEGFSWKENEGNTFLLNFAVGGHEDTTLQTDTGYQLFPPNMNEGKPSFYVSQVDPNKDESLRLLVTSYTFRFNGAQGSTERGTEFLPMTLQIASVEGVAVDLPLLTINVLKQASGNLMIASFGTAQPSDATSVGKDEDCNEWPLLCKWKGIVAERIEKMKKLGKGCHKRPHGHYNPMSEEVYHGKPPHRFRPGRPHHRPHHRPQHMGHGHHSQHRMHTFARRAFFTVFIPIVVGIFAGTVTYLLGMVLGTIVAIVIAKVRGQEYQRIALEEDVEEGEAVVETEADVQSEKQEYAELPAYDAPPMYEDAAVKADESKE